MNFPELLRRKLRYTGYTQEYVAKQIGVSATTVYYWASNRARPTIENIRKPVSYTHLTLPTIYSV